MDDLAIIAAQRNAYRAEFVKHGDTPLGTHQGDRTSLDMRFEALLRNLAPHLRAGTSIHEVGSGLCDLYGFLKSSGLNRRITYSGTEIVQEMIDHAAQKYPEVTLCNRNFLECGADEQYDFVLLSGTLNLLAGVEGDEWKAMCLALIKKMYAHANNAIAFNFLSSYRTFSDPLLYYFDPAEMFDFVTRNLSRFIHLDAGYPLYECTVTVFNKNYLSTFYGHDDLKKYFRQGDGRFGARSSIIDRD
ncbi:class I SAM-dependent methyltransferase [Bradyrhizobium sp.]|uniref:class I SAM-dependent methyltransferase n=1 Tax=Bradyrhizobium sp. TaxID=376 RepID=UPI002DF885E2|nr:class I SAM-dependent methyltransferase [Bradyrhizobium sp.]